MIEMIGKHIGVNAFRDRVELTGKDGGPVQFVASSKDRQL
jgi:hypothetical protein